MKNAECGIDHVVSHSDFCVLTSSFIIMEIKKGIGVSPGVVISMAVVLDAEDLVIPSALVGPDGVKPEIARYHRAIDMAVAEVGKLRDNVAAEHGRKSRTSSHFTSRCFGTSRLKSRF